MKFCAIKTHETLKKKSRHYRCYFIFHFYVLCEEINKSEFLRLSIYRNTHKENTHTHTGIQMVSSGAFYNSIIYNESAQLRRPSDPPVVALFFCSYTLYLQSFIIAMSKVIVKRQNSGIFPGPSLSRVTIGEGQEGQGRREGGQPRQVQRWIVKGIVGSSGEYTSL